MEIERYLLDKNIKPHFKGFEYLTYAIEMCQKDKTYFRNMTKRLYKDIASDLDITSTMVERSIRNAIQRSGYKQCISEFVARAVIELRLSKPKRSKAK